MVSDSSWIRYLPSGSVMVGSPAAIRARRGGPSIQGDRAYTPQSDPLVAHQTPPDTQQMFRCPGPYCALTLTSSMKTRSLLPEASARKRSLAALGLPYEPRFTVTTGL